MTQKQKLAKRTLITIGCFLPLIVMSDFFAFGFNASMIREQSDVSVLIGVVGSCVLIFLNYLLINLTIKQFKIMKQLFFILLVAVAFSCTRIDAGYEGILIKQYGAEKGVQDVTLVTGRVTYNPFTEDVEQIPLFVQTVDYDPFTVNDKDGSVFTVDPTLSIKIIKGMAPTIYQKYRRDVEDIVQTTILNYIKDAYRIQFNKYSTNDVISKREELDNNVQNAITLQLEKEGFHLEQLTSGLKYPDIITNAVNAKNEAVQKAMQIENQLRAAEAQAKIKVATAEGAAQSLVIQAKADAEANKLRQQSLTSLLIQQQFIEKWNGQLPVYGVAPSIFRDISNPNRSGAVGN